MMTLTRPNQIAEPFVPHCPYPWSSDQGDGTFRNPILCADYSDPDAIRVGGDFYLTASSFGCTPGLPILHSRDLVNWTIIGHALRHLPPSRYAQVQPGCGVWAPAIRHHAGQFWIFFSTPDEGIYMTTAEDPAGPWSEPRLVQEGRGLIDPCPLWDDDGQVYLIHAYARSRSGIKDMLRVRPMSSDGTRLLDEGQIVFHAPERHPTIEGPKLLKKDGWYYILAPAGGVEHGWQVALRSRNIYGPYEDKTVLEQGSTAINGPHQGALVDLPGGEWWFLHFQDAGAYGRITHLQPVTWRDGWPLMGIDQDGNGIGEPVLRHAKPALPAGPPAAPQSSDEFDSAKLGLQWHWCANYRDSWHSLSARPGWLRLFAVPLPGPDASLSSVPHLVLQRFPASDFIVTTRLDFGRLNVGDKAGLIVTGAEYHCLAVERTQAGLRLVNTVCRDSLHGAADESEAPIPGGSESVLLRARVRSPGLCEFSCSGDDGKSFAPMGKPFRARAGKWVGAKIGLLCLAREGAPSSGSGDFDWFRFE